MDCQHELVGFLYYILYTIMYFSFYNITPVIDNHSRQASGFMKNADVKNYFL